VSEGGDGVWDMRTASARLALLQAELSRSSLPNRAVRGRGSFRCRKRGCSVTAPLGCDLRCECDVGPCLLAERAKSIVIYRSARTGRRQCSIVTLHAGNDVLVSRVQPPTTPCSVGWSQIAPPHEPMSRTGLLKKRLSTSLLPIKVPIHCPSPTAQPSPPTASSIAARIARATGPFRPAGNEAPRRVADVLFLKQIARGVAPAFAQCVEDV